MDDKHIFLEKVLRFCPKWAQIFRYVALTPITLNWKNFKYSFPLKTTFMDRTLDVIILQWSHYNWLTKANCENITYKQAGAEVCQAQV